MKNDYETALDMMTEIIGQMRRMPEPKDDSLGSESALKEQVRKLVEDKRKLAQSLDHVNEENNDLEITIGSLRAQIEWTNKENEALQAKVDSFDGVSRERVKKIRELEEQVHQLDAENGLLDRTVENLRKKLEWANAEIEKQNEAPASYREPKPCPFCGGKPDVFATSKERWVVSCHSDACAVNPETDSFDTIEEAVSAWNYRAGELTCDWR